MDDIIASVAWRDDDGGWHQANYWCYPKPKRSRYTVDNYGDGDHEDCRLRDIPGTAEIAASWREYAKYVVETGEDPLNNYFVRRRRTLTERWGFKFAPTLGGVLLVQARRMGKVYYWRNLPPHVVEFLDLDPQANTARLGGMESWAEFERLVPGVKNKVWSYHTITHDVSRSAETIRRERKALARRQLHRT
jgi:hypothetical protein